MSDDDDELIPVFVPSLSAVLLNAENEKGQPLTYEEVVQLRDSAACIMAGREQIAQLAERRGYEDIDPENCWYDWQQLRRELGREPELDSGPKFDYVNRSTPLYQQTIRDAQDSLEQFRSMLPDDGSPRFGAMLKFEFFDDEKSIFLWLANTRFKAENFIAELFEIPPTLEAEHSVGDEFEITPDFVLDWMVNDAGTLHGGFSIRHQRSLLPENEQATFDAHIGVTDYA